MGSSRTIFVWVAFLYTTQQLTGAATPWEEAPEVLAATALGDPYTVVRDLFLLPEQTYIVRKPIYIAENDTGIFGVRGHKAALRASSDFDANCDVLKIADVEKGILVISAVRDASLCLNNVTVSDLELDGLQSPNGSLGPVGNLRQASVGIYARSDSNAPGGRTTNHSGLCGSHLSLRRLHVHDFNVQCVGVSDWTNIVLEGSALAHVANAEYGGFREKGCTTLSCDSLTCGGQRYAWYCSFMHTLYFTRTNNSVIANTSFNDAMWGSGLDLTGAINTVVSNCSFSNIRQSVVYHANGGYARDGDNLTLQDITAINCSSIASIGSPNLHITGLRARGIRFGFYMEGGSGVQISDVDMILGGETPSVMDSGSSSALILGVGGSDIVLTNASIEFLDDHLGASLVLLDEDGTGGLPVKDSLEDVTMDGVRVLAASMQALNWLVQYVEKTKSCGSLQNLMIKNSVLAPRLGGDVSWGNCSGVLTLINDTTDSPHMPLHIGLPTDVFV